MSENARVKTSQEALEIARQFASKNDMHVSNAEAYADTWFEAGRDFDKSSANDLRAYLGRRF